jgi:hypothetical protein
MSSSKWGLGGVFALLSAALYLSHACAQVPGGPEGGLVPAAQSKPTAKKAEKPAPTAPTQQGKSEETPFCQCVDQSDSEAFAHIERALAAPLHSTGLEFTEQPLKDVINQLQEEYGIPIQIDTAELETAAIGTDSPITVSLHNISLKSALRLMLKPLQLTYIFQDEVLMITTQEAGSKHLSTCVYNVQGVIDESDPKSMQSLIDAIEYCVARDTWSDVNEKGIADIMPIKPGLLVISQTPAVQEKVRSLLMKARKVREQAPIPKDRPKAADSNSKQSFNEAAPAAGPMRALGPEGVGGFGGRGPEGSGPAENPFGN